MCKRNIFQGNYLISKKIADVFGYPTDTEEFQHGWSTKELFFPAFFYLTKRFGAHRVYDDYKDAGCWDFNVKQYDISIYISSANVTFMMFGRIGHERLLSPYSVKFQRRWLNERDNLIKLWTDERTGKEKAIIEKLFTEFSKAHSVNVASQKEFDDKHGRAWYEYVEEYNDKIINLDKKEFDKKYGHDYANAYVRHALQTLEKFLKNMLTPIWIRDVPYNIKGRISDDDARFYERYNSNIKIVFSQVKTKEKL